MIFQPMTLKEANILYLSIKYDLQFNDTLTRQDIQFLHTAQEDILFFTNNLTKEYK